MNKSVEQSIRQVWIDQAKLKADNQKKIQEALKPFTYEDQMIMEAVTVAELNHLARIMTDAQKHNRRMQIQYRIIDNA